jgi:hypothetical protein
MSDYRSPIWPYPVTAIGVMLATAGFLTLLSTRPAATTASAPATSAQDMSRLDREHLECDRQVSILMNTKDLVELERAPRVCRMSAT